MFVFWAIILTDEILIWHSICHLSHTILSLPSFRHNYHLTTNCAHETILISSFEYDNIVFFTKLCHPPHLEYNSAFLNFNSGQVLSVLRLIFGRCTSFAWFLANFRYISIFSNFQNNNICIRFLPYLGYIIISNFQTQYCLYQVFDVFQMILSNFQTQQHFSKVFAMFQIIFSCPIFRETKYYLRFLSGFRHGIISNSQTWWCYCVYSCQLADIIRFFSFQWQYCPHQISYRLDKLTFS